MVRRPDPPPPRRPPRLALLALLFVAGATAQERALPRGFGDIDIGTSFDALARNHRYEILDSLATPWENYLNRCGFATVRVATGDGELLATVNDFLVTELSFATPIRRGSDLRELAARVGRQYGPPDATRLRTAFGQETADAAGAGHITHYYAGPYPVAFSISGAPLWRYQVTVRWERARWHANKTLLCARRLEKAAGRRGRVRP